MHHIMAYGLLKTTLDDLLCDDGSVVLTNKLEYMVCACVNFLEKNPTGTGFSSIIWCNAIPTTVTTVSD